MKFIVERIESDYRENGVDSAREKYRKYFIHTQIYKAYKAATDMKLKTDGYGDCIVTE